MEQTVIYKGRGNFQVCTRRSLHNCVITFRTDASGDPASIRLPAVDIEPAPDCDNMGRTAIAQCSDAGVAMFGTSADGQPGPDLPWIRCAARHGFVYRGVGVTHVDPRDVEPGARPGDVRLQCDEGYLTGHFDDTL